MVGSVGQDSSCSALEQHIEQLVCSVSSLVPHSHDIRDVVAMRPVEQWLRVERVEPSIFSLSMDTSQYEPMTQACHLRNVRRVLRRSAGVRPTGFR
mgnify:CR=1 FL=1